MTASITCRFALRDDRSAVTAFLAAHWRANHIFVESPDLLDWQHWDEARGRYNLAIATDGQNRILSLLGFIPFGHFDESLGSGAMALAIWVSAPSAPPGLGVGLLRFLLREVSPSLSFAIGLSQGVIPLYKVLGFTLGRLDHFVYVNPATRAFAIASGVPDHRPPGHPGRADVHLERLPLSRLAEMDGSEPVFRSHPAKSPAYLLERYGRHPAYEYEVYGIRDNSQWVTALVCRSVSHASAKAIRVVDVLGQTNVIGDVSGQIADLLGREDAEYLDVYCTGIPAEDFTNAGFFHRQQTAGLMIPNHFEPFEAASVELDYAWQAHAGSPAPRLLRGDTDQDRPNVAFRRRTG